MTFDYHNLTPAPIASICKNAVATSQPLATQAGIDALRKGGNACDAALAAAITLTVVEPNNNGLGSDAFALIWDGKSYRALTPQAEPQASLAPLILKARRACLSGVGHPLRSRRGKRLGSTIRTIGSATFSEPVRTRDSLCSGRLHGWPENGALLAARRPSVSRLRVLSIDVCGARGTSKSRRHETVTRSRGLTH